MTIKIPEKCENLFLDVGLSIDAPNSALWLVRDSKSFVIGVEPSPENTAILKKGRPPTVSYPYLCLNENAIIRNGTKLNTVDNRFCLLQYAIDNVSAPSSAPFYMTDDRNTGCSSLLKPTDKLGLDIKQIYQTPVVSLKTILDNVSFLKFKYITLLKTDTQGKDLDVIKSCGEYLDKTLIIKMEVRTNGQYEDEQKVEDIIKFMKDKNFSLLADSHYDHLYLNHPLASKLTTLEKDFSTRLSQLLDMAMDNYEEQTQN
jgi:hypothetical protein|tara:strand:+ start:376 stop:1149 length:774 start_codon:yes stop_codon:yes gene_type:complete